MRNLAILSYAITAVGVLMVAIALIGDMSDLWLLSGLLLAIAGVVKIAVVQIWQRIAGL